MKKNKSLKCYTLEDFKSNIVNAMLFGKSSVTNQEFFSNFFNKFVILVIFLLLGKLIIYPMGMIFYIVSIIMFQLLAFVALTYAVNSSLVYIFTRTLQIPTGISANTINFAMGLFLVFFNLIFIMFTYVESDLNFYLSNSTIFAVFNLKFNFISSLIILFGLIVLNYLFVLLEYIFHSVMAMFFKGIPDFSVSFVTKFNVFLGVILLSIGTIRELIVFATDNMAQFNYNIFKNTCFLVVMNIIIIASYIVLKKFVSKYRELKITSMEYYCEYFKNLNESKRKKIFYSVVKDTEIIRTLLISILFFIFLKYIIIFLF